MVMGEEEKSPRATLFALGVTDGLGSSVETLVWALVRPEEVSKFIGFVTVMGPPMADKDESES